MKIDDLTTEDRRHLIEQQARLFTHIRDAFGPCFRVSVKVSETPFGMCIITDAETGPWDGKITGYSQLYWIRELLTWPDEALKCKVHLMKQAYDQDPTMIHLSPPSTHQPPSDRNEAPPFA